MKRFALGVAAVFAVQFVATWLRSASTERGLEREWELADARWRRRYE